LSSPLCAAAAKQDGEGGEAAGEGAAPAAGEEGDELDMDLNLKKKKKKKKVRQHVAALLLAAWANRTAPTATVHLTCASH
jgi:hypothetical protein